MKHSLKFIVIIAVITLAALGSTRGGSASSFNENQDKDGLPETKGVEIVRDKCISCHEADLIVSQKLSKQGWTKEVDKMIRWGADVKDTEKEPLVEYLATHFCPCKK